MRTIKKWDKESPINGISAEKVLNSNPSFQTGNFYLVMNGDCVERIEKVETIRTNTGFEGTDEEVMNKYLASIEDPSILMSREELIEALKTRINDRVNNEILSGFVWNDMPVWLSIENQNNYKAAYDLAFQTQVMQMPFTPVKFKFGIDEAPIYHDFTSFNELADFYVKAVGYVQSCYEAGWSEKDSLDSMSDEELRTLLKQTE